MTREHDGNLLPEFVHRLKNGGQRSELVYVARPVEGQKAVGPGRQSKPLPEMIGARLLDVVEKGYRSGDTVIRPARVVVAA